jgi:iron complex transport system substrate-binding protein
LVIAPCGFSIDRTAQEMPTLEARPGWADLRAVRTGRVYLADGNLYFNRSGPSVFVTPQILAEILHPDAVAPALEGQAWRRHHHSGG